MHSKSFEFHSGKDIIKFINQYPRYYFSTITTPHSTWIEMSRTPQDGFYSYDRIKEAATRGDFD